MRRAVGLTIWWVGNDPASVSTAQHPGSKPGGGRTLKRKMSRPPIQKDRTTRASLVGNASRRSLGFQRASTLERSNFRTINSATDGLLRQLANILPIGCDPVGRDGALGIGQDASTSRCRPAQPPSRSASRRSSSS
jgi:hypothetical protein